MTESCKLPILDIWSHFFVSVFLPIYRGRGGLVKKVNLKSSRYTLKPKIGKFGQLKPFLSNFFFSTAAVGGGGKGKKQLIWRTTDVT